MSIKRNVVANYMSQAYVAMVGILIMPLLMKYLGPEAFGLIGFFAMVQVVFTVLDVGLTPTIGRESSRYKAGAISSVQYAQVYRVVSVWFTLVASVGGCLLFFSSSLIASEWLKSNNLPEDQLISALQIIAISVSFRWMCGLYRGVISGAEKFIWLGIVSVVISTLRFVIVLPVMWLFGFTTEVFFLHQLFVAIFEFVALRGKSKKLMPIVVLNKTERKLSVEQLRPILGFALKISIASVIWVFVTQSDKLVLSGLLTLSDYGYFTLATLIASSISVLGGPVGSALMPRMTQLESQGEQYELVQIYRRYTRIVAVISGAAVMTVASFANILLVAWTGDQNIATNASPILIFYALGNGVLAMTVFPYYMQYAKGDLTLHLRGNVIFVATFLPLLIYCVRNYGPISAGYVWLGMHSLYFLLWVPRVHNRFIPKFHSKWLFLDVAPAYIVAGITSQLLKSILPEPSERVSQLLTIILAGVVVLALSAFSMIMVHLSIRKVKLYKSSDSE